MDIKRLLEVIPNDTVTKADVGDLSGLFYNIKQLEDENAVLKAYIERLEREKDNNV
jgi:hypothetical protein